MFPLNGAVTGSGSFLLIPRIERTVSIAVLQPATATPYPTSTATRARRANLRLRADTGAAFGMIVCGVFDRDSRVTTFESPTVDTGQRRRRMDRGAGTGGMSETQTEQRVKTGQSRTGSASPGQGDGKDEMDQAELSRHLAEIAEKSQRLVADF